MDFGWWKDFGETAKCHEGNILVFKDPQTGIKIYGGGWNKGVTAKESQLQLSLMGDILVNGPLTFIGFKPQHLQASNVKAIMLSWTDGEKATLTRGSWLALVKELRTQARDVVVYCIGGHGRTGTTLAILGSLMGAITADPIKFIRTNYCKRAIETGVQMRYIQTITGFSVKAALKEHKKSQRKWFSASDVRDTDVKDYLTPLTPTEREQIKQSWSYYNPDESTEKEDK